LLPFFRRMLDLYKLLRFGVVLFLLLQAYLVAGQANVTITQATAVGGVPACVGGDYIPLTDIEISETDSGGPNDDDAIGGGNGNFNNVTLVLGFSAAGFEFEPGVGTVTASPLPEDITINSFTITASEISIDFDALNANGPDVFNTITISGLSVRSTSAGSGTTSIVRTGGTSVITGLVNGTVLGTVSNSSPPNAILLASETTICAGTSVTFTATPVAEANYEFLVGGSTVQNGTSFTYTTSALIDGQSVQVLITNATGCEGSSNTIAMTVNANPIPTLVSSDGDNIICQGESVTFTAGGGTNYEFFADGTSVQNGASDTYVTTTLLNGQTVSVRVTNASGCSATSAGIVTTVNANPVASLISSDGDNIICSGESVTFTATPAAADYIFRINTVPVQSGASNQFITTTLANGEEVDVIVTTASGCSDISTGITMTVNANPIPTLVSSDGDNIICQGESVTFTAGGGTNYEFFADGTSVQNGASDTYVTTTLLNGQTVSVRVTNASGCSATSAGIVTTVNANPVASLISSDGDNIICSGESVTFTATPAAADYIFRINTVPVQSGASNQFITTTLANGEEVDVIVTTASGCSDISTGITMTVNANPIPTLVSSDGDNIICQGESVTFTAGGGTNYEFFADGTSVQNGASDTYVTTTLLNGQTVSVRVTNASGCSVTSAGIVTTVNANPVASLISSDGDNIICSGESVTFTATPAAADYIFRINTVPVQSGASNQFITTTLANGEEVDVIVTTASGCSDISTGITMTVNANPIPTLVSSDGDNIICQGESVTFTAGGGTNYEFFVSGTSVQNGASDTYVTTTLLNGQTVSVRVTNASGCSATSAGIVTTVNANPVASLISSDGDNIICSGESVTFTATPAAADYIFRINTVPVQSGASNQFITTTLANGEEVDVIVTTASGCSDISTGITMTVNANPIPTLVSSDGDNIICQGESVTFTAGGGTNYEFFVDGTSVQNGASDTYVTSTLLNGQTVSVRVTNASGCSATSAGIVTTVNANPVPAISGLNTVCADQQNVIYSTAASGNNFSWSVSGGTIDGSTIGNSIVVDWGPAGPGTVQVTETIGGTGCFTVSPLFSVTINPRPTPVISGSTTVCQNEAGVVYSTPDIAGDSYLWTVVGGNITSGAGTSSITVTWGLSGAGSVQLVQSNTLGCISSTPVYNVTLTPGALVNAGSDGETCQDIAYEFSTQVTPATATNFNTILWTHTGTGSLANATTLTPTYTPGAGETGVVTFTLTATGNGSCLDVNDQMIVTITPSASVNAGSDEEICQGTNFAFSAQGTGATASNFSTILWTHTGTGTIFNANTLTPTYQPGAGESGAITFTLTGNGSGSCGSVNDQMILTLTPGALVNAGSDGETCQDIAYEFSTQVTPATATNFNTILWTHTGTGSLANATTLTPTYTPGAGETGVVTFTLTATGNGSCPDVNDQMIVTITPSASVNAGSDEEICQGTSFAFSAQGTGATASNFSTILWTHTGTGTIFNANTLTPTYQPGAGESGAITFTLTGNGSGSCGSVNDQMILTLTPGALVNAGSDGETCQDIAYEFSTQVTPATATNFNTILWTHTGTGSLANATTLTPTYTPGAGETGVVTFTLTATGNGSCPDVNDQMIVTITPSASVNAGSDEEICQGTSFAFSAQGTGATASNFSTILWTHTGTGTIFNANTLTPTYQPGAGESGAITFTLTGNGSGSCGSVNDQMILTLTPGALVNAGSDGETCQDIAYEFSTQVTPATATNFNTILWTHTGTGSLANATTLTPTYTPGAGETGVVTFTLTATGNGSCPDVNDQMIVTITPSASVNAGSDEEICQGTSFAFSAQGTGATASNFSTILWTHTGTGTIFNANTLTPTYQPGAGESGAITFTLTGNGSGSCGSVNDQMILTLTPGALVNAGSDGETCQDIAYEFSTQVTPATATNFNTILWTHTGTGSLANATTLTPTYTPGAGETGVVTFTLTATGNGSCPDVNDQMIVTITPSASVNAGSDEEICQGTSFAFSAQGTGATASNFSTILWTHTGTGTIFNANTLTPTYQPGAGESGAITFTLTGNGSGSCGSVNDQMILTLTPGALVNAGSDGETCQDIAYEFSTQVTPATATNFNTILWTHTGTGSLANATTLTPTYTPGAGETGVVTFTLTAVGDLHADRYGERQLPGRE
jgi:primase-polymerase (primpol)-like protein